MKTPESITEILHARSDRKLRARLEEAVAWAWKEGGQHNAKTPNSLNDLNHSLRGTGIEFSKMPWCGAISQVWVETQFLYLRDIFREKEVADFMQKVESVCEMHRELESEA